MIGAVSALLQYFCCHELLLDVHYNMLKKFTISVSKESLNWIFWDFVIFHDWIFDGRPHALLKNHQALVLKLPIPMELPNLSDKCYVLLKWLHPFLAAQFIVAFYLWQQLVK